MAMWCRLHESKLFWECTAAKFGALKQRECIFHAKATQANRCMWLLEPDWCRCWDAHDETRKFETTSSVNSDDDEDETYEELRGCFG